MSAGGSGRHRRAPPARTRVTAVGLLLLFALPVLAARPGAAPPRPGMLVLVLPGLAIEDVRPAAMPRLAALAKRGTVALLNTVTRATFAEDPSRWDAFASASLTLGMGGRGWSPPVAFSPEGVDLPAPDLARLRAVNQGGTRAVPVGYLGSAIRRAGDRAAVLGCADDRGERHREVILSAMDGDGAVSGGDVSPRCLRPDPACPYGWVSDAEYLLAQARRFQQTHALVWIDPGDLERAERYAPLCTPAVAATHRRAAITQADRLVGGAAALCAPAAGRLLIVAPLGRRREDGRRALLTPLVAWESDQEPGLFYSGSTRQPGLVANTDLAGWLVRQATGQAPAPLIHAIPRATAWSEVAGLAARIQRADQWRRAGIRVVHWLLLAAAALAIAAAWWRWPARPRGWVSAVPLLVFALAWLGTPGGPEPFALLAAAAALAVAAWRASQARPVPWAFLYGALAAGLLLEVAPWGSALSDSVLGYSLALGARYYGVGNEWMGVITGALLAALLLGRDGAPELVSRGWPLLSAGAMLSLLLVLGLPLAGADLGGALTAGVATAALVFIQSPRSWRVRLAVAAALAAGAGLGLLILWDVLRPPDQQTHLGRLLASLQGRPGGLAAAITAKLALNWRVARSLWGVLILAEAAASRALLCRAPSPERSRAAASVFGVTALAALLFNDSGATAAALLLAFLPPTLLLLPAPASPGPTSGAADRASPADRRPGS